MALTAAELEAVMGMDASLFDKGLEAVNGKLEKWGGTAAKLIAGVAVTGGGLFAAGLANAMGTQDATAHLQAELGLTAKESARYGKIAGKLYADNYGDSVGQMTDAVGVVIGAFKGLRKQSDADISAVTARAQTFASVFGVDLERAVQVAGQTVKTGLAKNATEAFDLMTTTFQKVPKSVREDVMDAADEYGPFFKSLGLNGAQAFGLLAKGAAKGMYGIDKTGDALKEFTIRSTDMSSSSKVAYDLLGMSQEQMTNKILKGGKSASGAFQQIVTGLLGMKDPAKQSQAALALFGTPLEDLSVQDMPKFLKSLQAGGKGLTGFKGSTDKMSQAVGSTASANLATFGRNLQMHTVAVIGGVVIPAVTAFTGVLATGLGPAFGAAGDAAAAFGGFISANATPLGIIAALIAAVFIPHLIALGVQSTIAAAKSVASWLITQAGAIAAAAVHSVAVVGMVAGWVLMGAQSLLAAARVAAAWLIAIGPIGIAIAAIAGAVYLIIKHWDTIKRATAAAWSWVLAQVKKVPGLIVSYFLHWTLPGLIIGHWDDIKTGVQRVAGSLVDFIKGLPGKIATAASGMFDGVKNAAKSAFNAVASLWNGTVGKLSFHVPGWVPKMGGKGWSVPKVPLLATGAYVDGRGVLARFGEAGPESVLPDRLLRGLLEKAHAAGASQAQAAQGHTINVYPREGASGAEVVRTIGHELRVARYGGAFA